MKKIFLKIHLWLSVPFGIVLFLICFSGAMLVFEDEITELVQHDRYHVEQPSAGAQPLPLGKIARMVEEGQADGATVRGITIFPDPERAYQVSLSNSGRGYLLVDPYTGAVKGQSERLAFFQFMFRMHRWLLDSRPAGEDGAIFWGKKIVGVSTLVFLVILITGIVVWWPRTVKALKNSLKLFVGQGKFRFWHSLHVAGGMYALLFLLLMALTGLTWSFPWYSRAFYALCGADASQTGSHGSAGRSSHGGSGGNREGAGARSEGRQRSAGTDFSRWQEVYDRLAATQPRNLKIQVADGTATVSNNRWGNMRGSDRYSFDPKSGEILSATLYRDGQKSGKIRGWIYSLHVGSWGGLLTRILAFFAALLGASLPLTGYYLWIRRLWRKRKAATTA